MSVREDLERWAYSLSWECDDTAADVKSYLRDLAVIVRDLSTEVEKLRTELRNRDPKP